MNIAIDASRNRSGGAKAHLIGILSKCIPARHGIQEIHVWAFKELLDQVPDYPWLIKHNPASLEQSLSKQLGWQATALAGEIIACLAEGEPLPLEADLVNAIDPARFVLKQARHGAL